jgi:hypothetical protein
LKVIENLECPKGIVSEIKRALKQDGLLLVSTPDKQAYSNQRNYRHPDHQRETYVPEIQKPSGQHSEHLRTYRQGTVAGGFISQASEKTISASIETSRRSLIDPYLGVEPPATHFVLVVVCTDAEIPRQEDEQAHLLLDRDRGILDEYENHAEDVGLLRYERRQGQETEVLTSQEALRFRKSEPAYLRAQVDRLEAGRSTWKSYRAVSTVWETPRSGGCPTLIGGYEPGYEP